MTKSVWGPVEQDMRDLLHSHPDDVPAVVDQLAKLQDVLGRVPPLLGENPLCDFNQLYLTVTESVLERNSSWKWKTAFSRSGFRRPGTYEPDASPRCPRVWAGLFRRIPGPDCRRLPAACAGVNAHINFDLPFALVTTFDHLGSAPIDDSDQHDDYLQINEIFASAIPELRRGYLEKWQLLIDTMNGCLDDWWQGEAVEYSRNVA